MRESTCCCLPHPDLHPNKGYQQNTKEDEESNDSAIGPRVPTSAPLESEEKADNGRNKDNRANRIKLLNTSPKADDVRSWRSCQPQENEDDDSSDRSERGLVLY